MNTTDAPTRLQIACPHCHTANRVPAARLDDGPQCGHCGKPLVAGQVTELGDADFDAVVAATRRPVVVDFWAPWCGPCRAMAPQFAQAAQALAGRALLVKVNSDDNPGLSARYGIRSIPTLLRLQGTQEVARRAGALPAAEIVRFATA